MPFLIFRSVFFNIINIIRGSFIVNKQITNTPEINHGVTPFESPEEAWFWFIAAQQARNDGARFVAGSCTVIRPCEPVDILKILDRLYRNRKLVRDHLLVLRHYGRRNMSPDYRRSKEARASYLWDEAMDIMASVMESKGIIIKQSWVSKYG